MENQKRKRGRPGKDGAKHRSILIRVDDDFRDELKELCEIEGVSMTEYIIRSVRQCGNLTRFKKQEEEENLADFDEYDFYDDETEDLDE